MVVVLKDFNNMFWGVTIGGGKRYSQMVERSFHISMAALEPSSAKGCVSVMIQHEKAEFLLCSLDSKTLFQQALDLNFTEGEEVTFFLNGTGVVHLTGCLIEEEEEDEGQFGPITDSDEEDTESSDEDAPELIPAKPKDIKRKLENKFNDSSSAKKKKSQLFQEMDLDESDDSEDEDYDAKFIDDEAEEDSDAEDSEDEVPEDEFSDEEEEEEEEPVVSSKKAKKLAKQEKKKSQEDLTPKQKANKEKSSKNTPTVNQSLTKTPSEKPPASEGETTEGKKKKKKKKKKNKGGEESVNVNGGAVTPKSETKSPVKRVVGGGVIVEDLQTGHGPEAKAGKMVHVYYSGKLTNGKPFDSCSSGKPFCFRLGKGEVIKGWDNGFAGMKVGGKRKITVPPQQGYGSQRQGPIPPNSTLVFNVELKAVS